MERIQIVLSLDLFLWALRLLSKTNKKKALLDSNASPNQKLIKKAWPTDGCVDTGQSSMHSGEQKFVNNSNVNGQNGTIQNK